MTSVPFTLEHTFDAPRDLLWNAWTDARALKQWWGHQGSKVTLREFDPRVGGTMLYQLQSEGMPEMWGKMAYQEITAPERLVFINSFSDANGGLTRHPMCDTWPLELLTTITFVEQGGKTTMSLCWDPLPTSLDVEIQTFNAAHESMKGGWGGTLRQLEAYLARAQKTIVSTRLMDAPRDLIFRAWSEPEHVAKWWGPNGFTNTITEHDFRPGGDWKLVMHGPDGTDYANHWIFREIVAPETVVLDHISQPKFHTVATFEDRDGKTFATFIQEFETIAIYDALKPICVPANEQNFDRLEAHLKTMR